MNLPMTPNSIFMWLSHFPFLIGVVIWFYKRRYVGAILLFLSLISSLAYHWCWGITNDPAQYNPYSRCVTSPVLTFILLSVDLFFANVASLHTLFWLLPHRGYFITYRYLLTIGTGLVIATVGLATKFYIQHSLDNDSSGWMALAVFVYFVLLYIIHTIIFLRGKNKRKRGLINSLRQYYRFTFHVPTLLFSITFSVCGILLWILFQRLYSDSYFLLHPFWHILIGTSGCLFGLALRSEKEVRMLKENFKNNQSALEKVAIGGDEFVNIYD